jgi:hypothetical protein
MPGRRDNVGAGDVDVGSVRVGWPDVRPGGKQKLAPLSVGDLPFTRAIERVMRPLGALVLELGARNGWYTGAITQLLGPAGKVFSADEFWDDPKEPWTFDHFIANRWDEKEKIIPLRGSHVAAMKWVQTQKGTIDNIVISNGGTEVANTSLLRWCWGFFPRAHIVGNSMLLDANSIAVKAPAGSVFVNHRSHFEWTPAK